MRVRISKISLILFVGMLVLSGFLLSVAGNYWPWYAVMSVFALVPIIIGPKRYRLLGALALVLSGVLIVHDVSAGKQFQERHPGRRP